MFFKLKTTYIFSVAVLKFSQLTVLNVFAFLCDFAQTFSVPHGCQEKSLFNFLKLILRSFLHVDFFWYFFSFIFEILVSCVLFCNSNRNEVCMYDCIIYNC